MMLCRWRVSLVLLVQLSWAAVSSAQVGPGHPVSIASSHVALGQPIAIAQNAGPAKSARPLPASPGIIPVGYSSAESGPIATAPRTVEATSPQPWPVGVYNPEEGTEFAAERSSATLRRVILPADARPAENAAIARPQLQRIATSGFVTQPAPMLPTPPEGQMPPVGQMYPSPAIGGPSGEPSFAPPAEGPYYQPSITPSGSFPHPESQFQPPFVPAPTAACASPDGCPTILPQEPCCTCWYDPGRRSWYLKGEYLLWWLDGYSVPPLASTGILNAPGTQVLLSDSINRGATSGARFTLGYWLTCDKGLELTGFFLSPGTQSSLFRGAQYPTLFRPFFSLNRNAEFAETVNFPGQQCGDLSISSPMNFYGIESNYRCNWCCSSCVDCTGERGYRVDVLVGSRYLNLDESLAFREDIITLPPNALNPNPPFPNQQVTVLDSFGTRNRFYGVQAGLDAEWRMGRWSFGARGKLAVGVTQQRVDIAGSQRLVSLVDGTVQNFQGGLLALPSNIGNHARDRFSVVPELTLMAGYQLLDHVRIFGGYNVMGWTSVVRPGDQIDRNLDETEIPNFPSGQKPVSGNQPQVPFRTSNFWAQGLNFGIEVRY